MPQFELSEAKIALAPITVLPSGLYCQAEVFLGPNEATKVATSGMVSFTSTGAEQLVRLPITMSDVEGSYHVYIDIYVEDTLIAAYQGIEDVVIISAPALGWFWGDIYDAETGYRVAYVEVTINADIEYPTTIGSHTGFYQTYDVTIGTYTLRFSREGYQTKTTQVTLYEGSNWLDITLYPI